MIGRLVRCVRRRRAGTLVVKDLLEGAEALARAEGLDRPGGEHLLLAACDLPDGTAVRALEEVGVDRATVATAVAAAHADALDAVGIAVDVDATDLPPPPRPRGVFRSEPSLQALLRHTYDLVEEVDGDLVGAWVLVAATDGTHGTVARALDRLGPDRDELRAAARRVALGHDA